MTDAPTPAPTGPPTDRLPLARVAAITGIVLLVGALAALAYTARTTLILVFVGFFLATGIEPAIRAMGRRGVRRGLAVALVVLGVLALTVALVAVLLVPAVRQIGQLGAQAPAFLDRLQTRLGTAGAGSPLADPSAASHLSEAAKALATAVEEAAGAVFGVLGALLGGAFASLTALVLMVYFGLAMPRLREGLGRALGGGERAEVMEEALGRVGGYVSGQLLVSAVAGTVSFLFFLIAGVPYPALLGLIVAVLDALPQIGAALASLAGVATALTQSWGLAVATLIFFCAYQAVENYLVAPRVFSRTIELSPVAAFVALLLGGSVGGLLGALTALPITAAGKVVLRHVLAERRAPDPPPAPREPSEPPPPPSATPSPTPSAVPAEGGG